MIFSNSYRKSSTSYQKYHSIPMSSPPPQNNRIVVVDPPKPGGVKLKWGKPIWTFFHTMAQKMNEEHFHLIIGGFMQMITSICSVLPCPVCSKHAIEYLNSKNTNNIRSKQELIQFFHAFHNSVNERKGYPIFPLDSVVPAYENANTYAVIKEFIFHFEDHHRSAKLIVDDFMRRRIVPQVKNWINANIQYFKP
jgi:hypothetical protein